MKGTTVGRGDDRQDAEEMLRDEVEHLERILDRHERTISSLRRDVDLYKRSIGWRLQQRLIPFRKSMLAIPVVRQIYRTLYRAMEIWIDEGFLTIFSRTADKLGMAIRGKNFLVEGHDRRPPPIEDQYEAWLKVYGQPPGAREIQQSIAAFKTRPIISVLTVLDTDDASRVRSVISSLNGQAYERWEACVAMSAMTTARLGSHLDELCSGSPADSSSNTPRVRLTGTPD